MAKLCLLCGQGQGSRLLADLVSRWCDVQCRSCHSVTGCMSYDVSMNLAAYSSAGGTGCRCSSTNDVNLEALLAEGHRPGWVSGPEWSKLFSFRLGSVRLSSVRRRRPSAELILATLCCARQSLHECASN